MPRDFFDPTSQQQVIVLVESATLWKAERLIESCEHCNEEGANIPLDAILDRVTDSDPTVTDYILEVPAKCPNCRRRSWKRRSSSLHKMCAALPIGPSKTFAGEVAWVRRFVLRFENTSFPAHRCWVIFPYLALDEA